MKQVCIYEEHDYINTLSVKALLETSGIITYIPNENIGSIFATGGIGVGTFRILVPEDQVDQALEILKGHLFIEENEDENDYIDNSYQNNPQTDEVVLNGEKVEKTLTCPKCGSENIFLNTISRTILLLFMGRTVRNSLFGENPKKTCKECRYQWL